MAAGRLYCGEATRAARRLLRNPGFTALGVLTIALCVAPSLVFRLVDRAVLPPLPYPQPERLVALWQRAEHGRVATSFPKLALLAQRSRTLDVAAFKGVSLFTTRGERHRVGALAVTPGFFPILGAEPLLGRLLADEDDVAPLAHAVVVVSEAFWRDRLGGRPDVVGQTLELNDVPFTIVGVTREDFRGWWGVVYRWAGFGSEDLWIPATMAPIGMVAPEWRTARVLEESRAQLWIAVARIRDGFGLREVRADVDRAGAEVQRIWPEDTGIWPVPFEAVPLAEQALDPTIVRTVSLLKVAGLLVVLLGAINLGTMSSARASKRQRTMAVEWTLGSTRGLLISAMLSEAAIIGFGGGLLALALVRGMLAGLSRLEPAVVASPFGVSLDAAGWRTSWPFAGWTIGLAIAAALLGCAVPAWRTTRIGARGFSRAGAGVTGHGLSSLRPTRPGGLLVVTEVAFAVALTAPSLLLVRSVARLVTADLGFRSEDVVAMPLARPPSDYDPPRAASLVKRTLDNIARQRGVTNSAWISGLPLHPLFGTNVTPSGRAQPGVTSAVRVVSPGAFATLSIPARQGRDFDARDTDASAPVVILSELGARRLGVGVGDHVVVGAVGARPAEVVGVVGDVPYSDPVSAREPAVYLPLAQSPQTEGTIVVRAAHGADVGPAIRAVVSSLDRRLGRLRAAPLHEDVDRQLVRFRAAAWLLGLAAVGALLLAACGSYGVLSSLVVQSTSEIGIRTSLGATPQSIGRQLLLSTLQLAAIGLAIGSVIGVGGSRPLESYLFGVRRWDAWTLLIATGAAVALALIAASAPARRAMRVDVVAVLRMD